MSERKFKIGDHVEWCSKGLFDVYEGSENTGVYMSGYVIGYMFYPYLGYELVHISKELGGKFHAAFQEDHARFVKEPYQVVEGVVLREGCVTLINERDRKQSDQPLLKKA